MSEMNPWVAGIGAGVSILSNGVNALRSNKFMKEAKSDLKDLVNNPIKPFSVSAPMQAYGTQAMSEAGSPMGFTGAEKNVFESGMDRTANSIYNRAMSVGGGSGSRAVQGLLSAGLLDQTGNFAAKEAMLREERRTKALNRVAGYASGVQGVDNMNVNANINAQSDLNRAIGVQRENIGKFWSSLGGLGGNAFGYGLMTGAFKGKPVTSSFDVNSVKPGTVNWMPGDETTDLPGSFSSEVNDPMADDFGSFGAPNPFAVKKNGIFDDGFLSPKVRYAYSTLRK